MGAIKGHEDPCSNAMFVQTTILSRLGLIPSTASGPRSRLIRALTYITTPVLVAGAIVMTLQQVAMIVYKVFLTKTDAHASAKEDIKVNATISTIGELAFTLMCLRNVAVLLFLAKHRRTWLKLVKRANAVLEKISMNDSSYPIFYRAWRKMSLVAAFLTATGVLLVEGSS